MKTVSINDYYPTAYVERSTNQQISTHSIMSSIFTSLLSVTRNLLFANSRQIKNLNTRLSSIPSVIGSEKSYEKKFNFIRKKEEGYLTKALIQAIIKEKGLSYKLISNTYKINGFQLRINHQLKPILNGFNLPNLPNPSTQNT